MAQSGINKGFIQRSIELTRRLEVKDKCEEIKGSRTPIKMDKGSKRKSKSIKSPSLPAAAAAAPVPPAASSTAAAAEAETGAGGLTGAGAVASPPFSSYATDPLFLLPSEARAILHSKALKVLKHDPKDEVGMSWLDALELVHRPRTPLTLAHAKRSERLSSKGI